MAEKMYEYVLPIGDWSKDGHNQSENYTVKVNKNKEELIAGYLKSCETMQLSFDGDSAYSKGYLTMLSDYEEFSLTPEVEEILKKHGVECGGCSGEGYFAGAETAQLFMDFIKVSIPDLEFEFVNDISQYLFGYWGDLNISVGYGIFD